MCLYDSEEYYYIRGSAFLSQWRARIQYVIATDCVCLRTQFTTIMHKTHRASGPSLTTKCRQNFVPRMRNAVQQHNNIKSLLDLNSSSTIPVASTARRWKPPTSISGQKFKLFLLLIRTVAILITRTQ